MPDQRSVMKEFRILDEKRLAQGLTPAEQARLEKLRVLMGPDAGAPAPAPKGFDVNAAAAALRESLLPAGLRNRPPPVPVAAPPEPPPEPEPAQPTLGDALATAYADSPFSSLEIPEAQPQDALFEPSSLGAEPAPYDAGAQGWDASGQPYDPNAAYPADAGYDPNAPQQPWEEGQAWEAGAPPPEGAGYPAEAAYDPNAPQQAWDAGQTWDAGATPAAEGAPLETAAYADAAYAAGADQAWEPGAAPEAGAEQAWETPAAPEAGAEQVWETAAAPEAGAEQVWETAAAPEAGAEQAWETPAAPEPGAEVAWEAGAVAEEGAAQTWDALPEPGAEPAQPAEVMELGAEELTELEPLPGEALPPEGGSFTPGDVGEAPGWEPEPAQPEPPLAAEFGEYDAAGGVEPFASGSLGAEPPLSASLFDAQLEPAGEAPGEAAPPEPGAAVTELGEYDDTAGFGAEPYDASAVPAGAPGLEAPSVPELETSWQPEAALSGGFELASGGSFGAGADAAAPEWAQAPAPPPWEGTPALDLEAPPPEPPALGVEEADYEISPPPATEPFGTLPAAGAELFGAAEGDLAAPAEEGLAAGPDVPSELDYSHPDFSGAEEGAVAGEPLAELAPEAGAPLAEFSPEGAELAELTPDVGAELAPEAVADLAELAPGEELAEPEALDVAGFAEAAAAAVASESTDLAEVIEAPPEAEPGLEALPPEPAAPEELPAETALAATPEMLAALSEEELPTIDGADILEEIVEEVPAAPPQSLDFEPLEPEPPIAPVAPAPAAVEPAPAVLAPPPPAVIEPSAPAVIASPPPAPAVIAPPPVAAAVLPPPPAAVPAPDATSVPGSHRVVVHTVEGLVKRGVLEDPALDADTLALEPQPGAEAELVSTAKVKAIFFMLAPGEKAPAAEGKRVRVTFKDGRQVAGFSPDYRDEGPGFFMIPADTKTNTGRIWVYRSAVRQVSVS